MALKKVSLVIPTLNEEKILPTLFENLRSLQPAPHEIIFVDGPSKDETSNMILQNGYQHIRSVGKGRALQMNEGAFHATGENLIFLNADTVVPVNMVDIVNSTLRNEKVKLAGFTSIMIGDKKVRKFITFQNYMKTYLGAFIYNPLRCLCFGFRLLFGDQAMFCRRNDFMQVGGFNDDLPVMEDADLCMRLNQLGCIRQIRQRVYSSDRRVEKLGIVHVYLRYMKIYLYYRFGVSSRWLKAQYEEIR